MVASGLCLGVVEGGTRTMIARKRHRYSGCDSLLSSLLLAAGTRAGFLGRRRPEKFLCNV